MNWYYAVHNQQYGPVDDAGLARLHDGGVVKPDSLVWRDGMSDWQPYETAVRASTPPPTNSGSAQGVVCAECGRSFPPDEVIRLGSIFTCAACKPIVLQKMREGVGNTHAETIRNDHIRHEASIKTVGILYFLSGAFFLVVAVVGLFNPGTLGESIGSGAVFLAIAAFMITAGVGIRRLRPWARATSGVISGTGLLFIPLGTLINAYILYLLFSAKGKMVFSEEYKGVIAETPHIKYRSSIVTWILLGLLVIILLGIMAALIIPALVRHR
jgi:hypothetical protein